MWSDALRLDRTVATAEVSVHLLLYVDYLEHLCVYITVICRRSACKGATLTGLAGTFALQETRPPHWPSPPCIFCKLTFHGDAMVRDTARSCLLVTSNHFLISPYYSTYLIAYLFIALFPNPCFHQDPPSDRFDHGTLSCNTTWRISRANC